MLLCCWFILLHVLETVLLKRVTPSALPFVSVFEYLISFLPRSKLEVDKFMYDKQPR